MNQSFKDFVAEVEADLPAAELAELDALRAHHRRGRMLAEMRVAKGLTQVQLAALAELDQAEISRLENGHGNPTESTLVRMATALDAEWVLAPKPGKVTDPEPA